MIGVFFYDRPTERVAFGRALAEVTHTDVRAVEGALFVAEVAAICVKETNSPADCLVEARRVVNDKQLGSAIDHALKLAGDPKTETLGAARLLGNSGFVVHTLAFATFCFARHRQDPLATLAEAISAGGDTDTIAAILGGWLGAHAGESSLPNDLIDRIHDGPFGPTHLRALAGCLRESAATNPAEFPDTPHSPRPRKISFCFPSS